MKIVFIFFGLIMCACSTNRYVWKSDPSKNWYADKTECQRTSTQAVPSNGTNAERQNVFNECMMGKGWVQDHKENTIGIF